MKIRPCAAAAIAALAALSACTKNNPSSADGAGSISVVSTADECRVTPATAPSGNIVFDVKNEGSEATEFYLLDSNGTGIVGEVENIGPGLTRRLVVTVGAGEYVSSCKPGMIGDGIRAPFVVTDSGTSIVTASADLSALLDEATEQYADFVKDEVAELKEQTELFAARYTAGDDDGARALYADARTHWERIEPVAESFGDLDPRLDLREADLAAGQQWTGWHRIEKDLWPARAQGYTALTTAERAKVADTLLADTRELYTRTRTITFTADGIANGAKSLLDEVATGKVTGEEEYWSRTDLWDFQGNLDGARVAWEGLRPVLQKKDAELDATISREFTALQKLLDAQRSGDGFVSYDKLSTAEVKELSDAVNALAEPLSQMTRAVLS